MCRSAPCCFFRKCKYYVLTKKSRIILKSSIIVPHQHRESNSQPLYHPADGDTTTLPVCSLLHMFQNFVIHRGDWLSIKFCENNSFWKLFLFFENTFQYLGGISQDISVSHFDSRRSLSSANRRRSTSPILLVNFTQPCDQHDRKIRTIRKSAARGYRKLILSANLLYVPDKETEI